MCAAVDTSSGDHAHHSHQQQQQKQGRGSNAEKMTSGAHSPVKSNEDLIPIYTDWANHYLEKGQKKRVIQDLQKDMQDSLFLIDVVEAVTGDKVPEVKRKPKNAVQVVENIGHCLQYLSNLGVNVDGLTAKDIRDGQLKTILGLFFSLSRYKQQQKSLQQQQNHKGGQNGQNQTGVLHSHSKQNGLTANLQYSNSSQMQSVGNEMLSRLPSPFKNATPAAVSNQLVSGGAGGVSTSGIPSLSSSSGNSNAGASKVLQQHSSGFSEKKESAVSISKNETSSIPSSGGSKLVTPSSGLRAPTSISNGASKLIPPTVNNSTVSNSLSASTSSNNSTSSTSTPKHHGSGLKLPSTTTTNVNSKNQNISTLSGNKSSLQNQQQSNSNSSIPSAVNNSIAIGKDGKMLEKFKLFASKDSTPKLIAKNARSTSSANTSSSASSSGFSSGKSELSDSMENSSASSKIKTASPKMSLKALTKKGFGANAQSGKGSPKMSRKETPGSKIAQKAPSPVPIRKTSQTQAMKNTDFFNDPTADMDMQRNSRATSERSSDDNDSAYVGCDSSPSSSIAPSSISNDSKYYKKSMDLQQQIQRKSPPGSNATSPTNTSANAMSGSAGNSTSKIGIPKPTMAVKGTTKPPVPVRDDSTRLETTVASVAGSSAPAATSGLHKPSSLPRNSSRQKMPQSDSNLETVMAGNAVEKMQNSGDKERFLQTYKMKQTTSKQSIQCATSTTTGIAAPIASAATAAVVSSPISAGGAVVGVVSPITHHKKSPAAMVPSGGADLNSSRESTVGHQSDSNSSHTSGNLSDTPSVIYCPSAEEAAHQQLKLAGRLSRTVRSSAGASEKLREMSESPAGRTQSRLETTFDSSDGVIVTTQMLTPGSDEDNEAEEKIGPEDVVVADVHGNAPRFFDASTGAGEEELTVGIEPMAPLVPRASPYAYLKNYAGQPVPVSSASAKTGGALKVAQKLNQGTQVAVGAPAGGGCTRAAVVRAKSPRLLFNKPLATLLHTDANDDPSSALNAIRQATAAGDLLVAGGYASDGDALHHAVLASSNNSQTNSVGQTSSNCAYGVPGDLDISGYMSEGGISLYARKMQARFREGLEAVRDSMRERKSATATANFADDSCEDSSSLSSGISEQFDEISTDDLTGSSLSDHAAVGNFYQSPVHNNKRASSNPSNRHHQNGQHHNQYQPQRKADSGQQTDDAGRQQLAADRRQQQQHNGAPAHLRKLSENPTFYDRQKIDLLLQKSRTNARGQGATGDVFDANLTVTPSSAGRPKSEQMMLNDVVQLSADGQTLRVSAANFGFHSLLQQQQQQQGRRPLATNSLKIMKTDFSGMIHGEHIGDQQNRSKHHHHHQQQQQQQQQQGAYSGYHSLDRKKHLLAYHDLDPSAARYYYSDAENLYVNYSAVAAPRTSAGATLALVSPRRTPGASSGKRLDDSQQQQAQACWTRHSVSGHQKSNNGNNGNNKNGGSGSCVNGGGGSTMSRSMIEPEVFKMSSTSIAIQDQSNVINGNHRINGHARLSIPPQNVLQSGLLPTQSPRLTRCTSSQSETVGVPAMRKESGGSEVLSPSSQLHLHKLLVSSPTSAGAALGFADANVPSSPGSLSDRGSGRATHLGAPSPYMAAIIGGAGCGNPAVGSEEVHASSLSLASTSSSVYSSVEEKYQAEIRKLHREIDHYRDKVQTLTTQQSTYAHVVAAFEQSLQSIYKRMQNLTVVAEQKDTEITDLRQKMDVLCQISQAAGVNVQHVVTSSPSVHRRHTFNNNGAPDSPGLTRQVSTESMHSTASQRSSLSGGSGGKNSTGSKSTASQSPSHSINGSVAGSEKNKKRSWLRSSFNKLRAGKGKKNGENSKALGSVSDAEDNGKSRKISGGDASFPNSPLHSARRESTISGQLKSIGSNSALNEDDGEYAVDCLKRQLADKDCILTDTRLEALTSAHQIDILKEELDRIKNERDEYRRRLVSQRSHHGSQTSLPLLSDDNESVSEYGHVLSDMSVPISVDATMGEGGKESVRIQVSVCLNFTGELKISGGKEIVIGSICLSAKAKWDLVDTFAFKVFKEYVLRIDPVSNLGLSAESVVGYWLGECQRQISSAPPAVLPSSVLQSAKTSSIRIGLQGVKQNAVDSLAFETLIPKANIQRYVNSLLEDRRIIFCSLHGTGKTYLANKLAEYLVTKHCKRYDNTTVLTFDGGDTASSGAKAALDLKKFIQNLQNSKPQELPLVVILDNLHNMGSLNDLLTGLSNVTANCPYIIGTVNQSNKNTTSLQLHRNFRWHQCANHTEPIKGFLGRFLRRRLIESEVQRMNKYPSELTKIIDWLPKVWSQLNKYIEAINSSDATIGPAIFMNCPLDITQSRQWFVGLWNDTLVQYVLAKAGEGFPLFDKRSSVEDPYTFVVQSWPWPGDDFVPEDHLARLEPDVQATLNFDITEGGYKRQESLISDTEEIDPLAMLLRLKEQDKLQCQSDYAGVTLRQEIRKGGTRPSQNCGVESTL